MTRRYVVIGAGAIGAVLAAQFELAGIRSVLVARGQQLDAIRRDGLRVRRPLGDDVVRVETVAGPSEVALTPDDVLILATKSQDAEAAIIEWAWQGVEGGTLAADLPVLTFQNGLATEDAALRRFREVYAVSIIVAASYLTPGEVVSPSFPTVGVIAIGRYPDARDARQDEIAADLEQAGFAVTSVDDISAHKARKLLANVGNGLDVLSGSDEERTRVRKALVAETRSVFEAAGIRVAGPPTHALVVDPVPGHAPGLLSTWQSFARGAGSEVDHLNGEVVLIARRAGVPAPLNEALQRLLGAQAAAGAPPGTHSLSSLEGASE